MSLLKILMRSAACSLLCLGMARGAAISVAGEDFGAAGINGLAEGWAMSFSDRVSVAIHLSNGNGPIPGTGNVAYLSSGMTPTLTNIVAVDDFTLPGNYDGMFTVFQNLSLGAGSYWLILTSPEPPASYANWEVSDPATITTAPGFSFLGYSVTLDGGESFWQPTNNGYAYQLTVSEAPEPSFFPICLTVLTGCVMLVQRKSLKQKSCISQVPQK
jgi:hypothetical protein